MNQQQQIIQPPPTIQINEMPDIDHVHAAIKAMYENGAFEEWASKWLEELQRSIYAWKVSDQLLIKKIDYQSCYFAAQTLKTKILKSFNELPADSYNSLKDSIINHLIQMNEKTIRTQLSLALTYIFFMNPYWERPIEELSQKLPKIIFLEILICIGQEYDENRPSYKLTKKRRNQLGTYFSQCFNNIFQLLMEFYQESLNCDQMTQEQIHQKCLACFEVWAPFAESEDHMKYVESMLIIVFKHLRDPNCSSAVHERASDALCKVLYLSEANHTFQEMRIRLIKEVYTLEYYYQNAVASENTNKVMDLAKIFVELGISTMEYIANEQIETKILELILNCTAHYEFDVAEITFGFWFNFLEVIRKLDHAKFAAYFNLLLSSLTRQAQMDSDNEGLMDDTADVFDYRNQISELIEDLSRCFDWINWLKSINALEIFKPTTSWEIVEVHLYIIYCFVTKTEIRELKDDENMMLIQIINYVLTLPQNPHPQLLVTSCDFIGELNEWINENMYLLEPIATFLLKVISMNHANQTKIATKAATALKYILTESERAISMAETEWITKLFMDLVYLYNSKVEDRVELGIPILACCTAIMSNKNMQQNDQQEMFLKQLIEICLSKIVNVMNMKLSSEEHKTKWEKIINHIHAIFKNFQANEKTRNSTVIHSYIAEQIWPFLKDSMTNFAPIDSQVVEHCSRCIRHIVRSMKPVYLLQPIFDHIVPLYQQYPTNGSLIYIASVMVDEFANRSDAVMSDGFMRMFNTFSSAMFTFLSSNRNNLQQNYDVIDDYLKLCTRIMTKLTDLFLQNSTMVNDIINLVIMALYITQKDLNDSIIKFVMALIKLENPMKMQYLLNDNIGRNLFYSMIDSILFKLPGYFIPDMIDTIWAWKNEHYEMFEQYLQYTRNNLYEKIQKDGYNVTRENLDNFYDSCIKAKNAKSLYSEMRYLQRIFN